MIAARSRMERVVSSLALGLLAIQQGCALTPNFFPWHRPDPTAFDFFEATSNLLLPRHFGIDVDGGVEAIYKVGGQFSPLVFRQRQCVFEQLSRFHRWIIALLNKPGSILVGNRKPKRAAES